MSLQVWLPLNGDLKNNGVANVTITNSGATVDNNGKIGKCYSFNGSSNKITNTFSSTISSSIGTLACWVKFNALPEDSGNNRWYELLQIGTMTGFAGCRLGLYMEYSNKINISINGSSTGANVYTHSLVSNQWYHLCAIYDGSLVKLYINGNEVMSKTASIGSYTTNVSSLYIGGTNNYWLNGYMNDIRYYDHVLSDKEVKELSKGLILHYPLNGNGRAGENLFRDSGFNISGLSGGSSDLSTTLGYYNGAASNHTFENGIDTILLNSTSNIGINFKRKASDINLDTSAYYTISCEAKCSKSGATLDIGLSYYNNSNSWVWRGGTNPQSFNAVDTWQKFKLTFKPDSDTQYIGYCFTCKSGGNNTLMLKNCKLEKGSVATPWMPNKDDAEYTKMGYGSTVEYDTSGNGYNGSKIGTLSWINDTPRYTTSTLFDNGVNNYISAPIDLGDNKNITINLWVKSLTGANGTGNYHIPFCINGSAYEFSIPNSGKFRNGFMISGSRYCSDYGSTNLLDKNWHMITATYDGITIKRYIDGELVNSTSITGTLTVGSMTLYLGRYSSSSYGDINILKSDFRIYATALSADDIKALYNTGASIANNGTLLSNEFIEG